MKNEAKKLENTTKTVVTYEPMLCTDFISGKSEICKIKKYKVRAETKLRIHDHYYFEALCECDAKAMFLDKMNKKESFFQYIEIKEV